MSGPRVFVSASFPSGKPGQPFKPYDTAAIAEATTAVVRAVLRAGGRIVFGAHPTISPLVLLVAGEQGRSEAVEVYQSRFFEQQIPHETKRLIALGLAVPHWTDLVPGEDEDDPRPSLALMRDEMLKDEPFDAAVFIGGMKGIVDETSSCATSVPRFRGCHCGRPVERRASRAERAPDRRASRPRPRVAALSRARSPPRRRAAAVTLTRVAAVSTPAKAAT